MRKADLSTLLRIFLVAPILYLILIQYNPIAPIAIFGISVLIDGLDGYFAINEASNDSISLISYATTAIFGSAKGKQNLEEIKSRINKKVAYGPRLDIASDRITEYSLWFIFTYLGIIPIFVLVLIIIRHSIVDAFMGVRGTSSKMKTKFAKLFYSSNAGRGWINVLKFVAFSYLMLVNASNYPIIYGYILVAALFSYIMLRGIAEVTESLHFA